LNLTVTYFAAKEKKEMKVPQNETSPTPFVMLIKMLHEMNR